MAVYPFLIKGGITVLFDSTQSRNKSLVLEGQEHVIEEISVLNNFLSESVKYEEEFFNLKSNVLEKGIVHNQNQCSADEFSDYVQSANARLVSIIKNKHHSVFTAVQEFEVFLQKAEVRFYTNCGNISKRSFDGVNYTSNLIDYKLDKDELNAIISHIEDSIDSKISSSTINCCTTGQKYQFIFKDVHDQFGFDLDRDDLSMYRFLRSGECVKGLNDVDSMIDQLCDFDTDYELVETVFNAFERIYYKVIGVLNSGSFVQPDFASSFNYNRFSNIVNDYTKLLDLFAKITLHVIEAVVERRNSYEHALVYEIMKGE